MRAISIIEIDQVGGGVVPVVAILTNPGVIGAVVGVSTVIISATYVLANKALDLCDEGGKASVKLDSFELTCEKPTTEQDGQAAGAPMGSASSAVLKSSETMSFYMGGDLFKMIDSNQIAL